MSTAERLIGSHRWRVDVSGTLRNLQTWWLLLTASGLVSAILLVVANRRGSPGVEQLTVILAAAIFLGGIILSTISTERNAHDKDDPFTWLARLRCMMAIGIAVVAGFAAVHSGQNEHPAAIAGVGVLAAGAAWMAGILLGFIFGLPQAAKGDTHRTSPEIESNHAAAHAQGPTNLEQIADWLTKLLLGAGLTQITKIPGKLDSLASYIGKGMGDGEIYKLLALAICIFFFSCGFLFGYLWGRLFMPHAFRAFSHRDSQRERNSSGI